MATAKELQEALEEARKLRAERGGQPGREAGPRALTPEQLEEARRLRSGVPDVEPQPITDAREIGAGSAGELLARRGRLLGAGAVQGVGDIVSLPFSVADIVAESRHLHTEQKSGTGQAVRDAFAVPADFIRGDITPQDRGERLAGFIGEEAAAGGPIAFSLRKLAKARVAVGKAGRFLTGLAEESTPAFIASETAGTFGAAQGRLVFEETGTAGEIFGAVAGDLILRNFGPAGIRILKGLKKFAGISLKSVPEQDAKMRAVAEALREPGGIAKMVKTKEGREALADAAEFVQRETGFTEEIDAALSLMDEYDALARDLGVNPDDMFIPSPLANPGLATLMHSATSRSPTLAVRILAASERGSRSLQRKMITLGGLGPDVAEGRLRNVQAVAEAEATRRIDEVAAEVAENQVRQAAEVQAKDQGALDLLDETGEFALDEGADAARKAAVSEAFAVRIKESWLTAKRETVTPKYDYVEELAEQFANIRWSVKNSKTALAKVRGPLREAGELDSANDLFKIIDKWPDTGTEFARLRDMQKTLNNRIEDLVSNQKFTQAEELRRLKEGVDADILEYDLLDVDVLPTTPAARPDAGAAPPETGIAGLPRERSIEARRTAREQAEGRQFDPETGEEILDPFKRQTLRELTDPEGFARPIDLQDVRRQSDELRAALPGAETPEAAETIRRQLAELEETRQAVIAQQRQPEGAPPIRRQPAAGGGTIGRGARISEDTTVGLAEERARQILTEAMNEANEAHRRLAREYYEPVAIGSIMKAHRTHNPSPNSEQLGLFLSPGKGYAERVAEFAARAADSPETMKNGRDWLIADAYQRTVRNVKQPDGSTIARLDRNLLDRWKKRNATAINAVDGVKPVMNDARELVEQARKLGAVPPPNVRAANVQALNNFVADPQKFWDGIANMGLDKGRKAVKDVIATIRKSGDDAAMEGLKSSFMDSRLVRSFSVEGAGSVTPQQQLNAIVTILDTPALRETVTTLFGPENVRLLELAAKGRRALTQAGEIPGDVRAVKLRTQEEAFQELTTKSSAYNVIMGPVRRTSKISSALIKFQRDLGLLQRNAIISEAFRNPPLLRDLLTRDPSSTLIKGIKTRMNASHPTLFPRVERNQEELEEQREKREEAANRAIVNPPRTSAIPFESSGLFG